MGKKWSLNDFHVERKRSFPYLKVARHKKTNYPLALKIMLKQAIKRDGLERQVCHELELLRISHHKNITDLYRYFDDTENIYFILQLAPGMCLEQSLDPYQKVDGRVEHQAAVHMVKCIAEALVYLGEQGAQHRNLKPGKLWS